MPSQPAWAQPRNVALLIGAYLLAHFAVRLWMGPTLGLDDAEQALFAQHWLLNYRFRAPPLFTWALVGASEVVSPGVLIISIIRYVLLAMLAAFVYLTARRLIRDQRLAALATFSFTAIYVFGYYSHHDLTHTTVLSTFLAASWYVFVRLVERPSLRWYLALGMAFGLGMLGKWNFIVFAVALPLACLLFPAYRPLVLTWNIVPAALVTAAIVLPSALWALHFGPAPGDDIGTLLGRDEQHVLVALTRGTLRLAGAVLIYPQPFLSMFAIAFGAAAWRGWRAPEAAGPGPVPDVRFVGATIAIAVALHWLLVPLAGATDFDERLMQPALIVLPIYLFMLVERSGSIDGLAVRRYGLALAVLAGLALTIRVGLEVAGADYCRGTCRAFIPFQQLAAGLQKAGFKGEGTIVVPDFHIGGNLRVTFPGARIVQAEYPPEVWPPPSGIGLQTGPKTGQCLAVWPGKGKVAQQERELVERYLATELHVPRDALVRVGTIAAPMEGSTRRVYHLSYALYDAPQGQCR